jgi:hypothetical protein
MQPSSALNTISPAAILAQRAPNGSSQGQGTVMDGPTTIEYVYFLRFYNHICLGYR